MAPTRRRQPPRLTVILFVRHGQTPTTGSVLPGRARGLHLSDEGRAQAEATAARIQAVASVSAVYCSPLERTRETAAPIARAFRLRPRVERGLIECDFGDWTGAELKKLMKLPEWTTVQRYPSGFTFPGGESFSGMQARMNDTVARLRDRHPGETIVAVSHADPIKAAVASALGTHLDLFQRIMIAPCSVTAVAYGPTGPAVLAVNSTATIGDLRKPAKAEPAAKASAPAPEPAAKASAPAPEPAANAKAAP
jgi:probable phosphoglycerate mutase